VVAALPSGFGYGCCSPLIVRAASGGVLQGGNNSVEQSDVPLEVPVSHHRVYARPVGHRRVRQRQSVPTNPDNPLLVTIFIKNSTYSPNPATVKVGQSVNFKNDDNIEHSATTTSGPITFESGNIPPNSAKNAPVVMSTTGTINFRCRLHGETGSIVVVN
jgi:plastocyanin